MTDWRKIETVIVEWFRAEGADIGKSPNSGDTLVWREGDDSLAIPELNLTMLAKHLAEELKSETK